MGSALYLKETEARLHHRRGILRLFRLENGAQLKFLRRSIRFSRQAELTWFMRYRDYADDLLDSAVLEAFDTDPWELRDETSFGIAAEHARGELGETVDRAVKLLESLLPVYELCRELHRKIAARSDESAEDYAGHLDWLFREHFLKRPAVLTDYTRYLRGLKLRGERPPPPPPATKQNSKPSRSMRNDFASPPPKFRRSRIRRSCTSSGCSLRNVVWQPSRRKFRSSAAPRCGSWKAPGNNSAFDGFRLIPPHCRLYCSVKHFAIENSYIQGKLHHGNRHDRFSLA